jgi:branched-chain amino acid transport system permease protein
VTAFLAFTVVGIAYGCVYALTASGLVVTYQTTGIFNFAHGAIGMVVAFTYWELTVQHGWPQWLALVVVLGGMAPLLGAVIERVVGRRLHGASTNVTLMVTLGLLLMFIGLASTRWSPAESRVLPEFFAHHHVRVFTINITYHQLTMMTVAVLVAVFLRLLFYRTRIGVAMRAVVDDNELASLNGADPDWVATASWAIGATLAGVAGILLAPIVQLDIVLLTLLVINGYAAAMVGRLKSLPLTFAGGIALGLAEAYTVWKVPRGLLNKIHPSLPIIFLFLVLLILPQARLRVGRVVSTRRAPRVATLRDSIVGAVAIVVVAAIAAPLLSGSDLAAVSQGMVYALIMLSLVLLVGYAGQVSLAQMTFVGLGAFAMGKYFGGASVWGILLAALFAGAVGALAALPALRLQGLYLALGTFAFAQGMSILFFQNASVLGYGGRLPVGRPHIFGISFVGDRAYFMLICIVFGLAGIGVLALRRGNFGRRLVAMKDSPAACATLGINLTFTKLAVFAISAALAGVGGAFYGGLRGSVGSADFEVLQSGALLLIVTISGINTVTGALFGGLVFGFFPRLQQHFTRLRNLSYTLIGAGAIGIARNPNGWTNDLGPLGERVRRIVLRERTTAVAPPDTPAAEPAAEGVSDLAGAAR